MTEYKPGDVVDGRVLTSDGQWVPIQPDPQPTSPGPGEPPTAPAPTKNRGPWLVVAAVAVVLVVVGAVVLVVRAGSKPELDDAARQACDKVAAVEAAPNAPALSDQGMETVANVIAAVKIAESSTAQGLAAAAATTSPASQLPFNDPGYKNPGDVKFAAVADWCQANA